jgi:hypothetical protein
MENGDWGTSKAIGDILFAFMRKHSWQVNHMMYRWVCKLWRESCELPAIHITQKLLELPPTDLLLAFSNTSAFYASSELPASCLGQVVDNINLAVDMVRS